MDRDDNVQVSDLNYIIYTLIVLLIGLPLCSQGLAFACMLLVESSTWFSKDLVFNARVVVTREGLIALTSWFSFAVFNLCMLILGHLYSKYLPAPKGFAIRYSLFASPIIYTLLVSAVVLYSNGADIFGYDSADILFMAFIPFVIANVGLSLDSLHAFLLLIFLTYSLFALGVVTTNRKRSAKQPRQGIYRFCIIVLILFLMGLCGYFWAKNRLVNLVESTKDHIMTSEGIVFDDYQPFSRGNLLTQLRSPATLIIDSEHPRLAGASPLYPLYASAINNLYTGKLNLPQVASAGSTSQAYGRLINGEVDVVFATAPSEFSKRLAREKGVTLKLTPLAKEGLVFFVNENNPIDGLSLKQIRDIYSGQLKNWRAISGINAKIAPYHQPISAGSRIAMEAQIMEGMTAEPSTLNNLSLADKSSLAEGNHYYLNNLESIGYSFRYYVARDNSYRRIKTLAINGVEPTVSNIRSGRYPFSVDLFMVTTGTVSEPTQQLMDWFVSEQGQALVEDVGYVPRE